MKLISVKRYFLKKFMARKENEQNKLTRNYVGITD